MVRSYVLTISVQKVNGNMVTGFVFPTFVPASRSCGARQYSTESALKKNDTLHASNFHAPTCQPHLEKV